MIYPQAPVPTEAAWRLTVAMILRMPKAKLDGVKVVSIASSLNPKMFDSTEGPGKKTSGAKGGGPHREG